MRAPAAIPTEARIRGTDLAPLKGKELAAFRRALLHWYDRHRRALPWRKTRDPYRIWLSEIMLQQTRVGAVLDHYRVFLERFPNLQTLAAASEDAVLAAWSGLGYYRRARMLHQCAKEIVQRHGSEFPKSAQSLQALPGIGRYTAAAIASIAFNEPVAVVDGNVERVVQRLIGHDLAQRQIWQQAQTLLSTSRPGDFNQSMMELGAMICLPREPKCHTCPVRKSCVTARSKMERRMPSPGEATLRTSQRPVKKEIWCVLDQRNAQIRLVQRPARSSLMAGMWELPQLARKSRRTPHLTLWQTFRHSITITDYTVHVHRTAAPPGDGKWIPVADISHLPITGLTRKILKAAGII